MPCFTPTPFQCPPSSSHHPYLTVTRPPPPALFCHSFRLDRDLQRVSNESRSVRLMRRQLQDKLIHSFPTGEPLAVGPAVSAVKPMAKMTNFPAPQSSIGCDPIVVASCEYSPLQPMAAIQSALSQNELQAIARERKLKDMYLAFEHFVLTERARQQRQREEIVCQLERLRLEKSLHDAKIKEFEEQKCRQMNQLTHWRTACDEVVQKIQKKEMELRQHEAALEDYIKLKILTEGVADANASLSLLRTETPTRSRSDANHAKQASACFYSRKVKWNDTGADEGSSSIMAQAPHSPSHHSTLKAASSSSSSSTDEIIRELELFSRRIDELGMELKTQHRLAESTYMRNMTAGRRRCQRCIKCTKYVPGGCASCGCAPLQHEKLSYERNLAESRQFELERKRKELLISVPDEPTSMSAEQSPSIQVIEDKSQKSPKNFLQKSKLSFEKLHSSTIAASLASTSDHVTSPKEGKHVRLAETVTSAAAAKA